MGFETVEGGDWRPWLYNRTAVPMELIKWKFSGFGEQWSFPRSDVGEQLGGYVISYAPNGADPGAEEHSMRCVSARSHRPSAPRRSLCC